MNMRDPVVGGNSLEKIALRRAIALSYNQNEAIKQLYKGHADKAEMTIPEGVNGYNPAYKNSIAYNPLLANKLLRSEERRVGKERSCRCSRRRVENRAAVTGAPIWPVH